MVEYQNWLVLSATNYASEQMRNQIVCDVAPKDTYMYFHLLMSTVWGGNPATFASHMLMVGADILSPLFTMYMCHKQKISQKEAGIIPKLL